MGSKKKSIITPRVRRAQRELLEALGESIKEADFDREVAQGKLSAVISDIWNQAEEIAKMQPLLRERLQ